MAEMYGTIPKNVILLYILATVVYLAIVIGRGARMGK
jgi:hypothetical protein